MWFFNQVGLISAVLLMVLTLAGTGLGLLANDANPDSSLSRARSGAAAVIGSAAAATTAALGSPWLYLASAALMTAGWTLALGTPEESPA
jgi:hypothetical protein